VKVSGSCLFWTSTRRDGRQQWETSFCIAIFQAKNRTWDLPNRKQYCFDHDIGYWSLSCVFLVTPSKCRDHLTVSWSTTFRLVTFWSGRYGCRGVRSPPGSVPSKHRQPAINSPPPPPPLPPSPTRLSNRGPLALRYFNASLGALSC